MFEAINNTISNVLFAISALFSDGSTVFEQNRPVVTPSILTRVQIADINASIANSKKQFTSPTMKVNFDTLARDVLELQLTKCSCFWVSRGICECWQNFDPKEQPFVRGDPRAFINFAHQMDPALGFFLTHEQAVIGKMPSPHYLGKLLEKHAPNGFCLAHPDRSLKAQEYFEAFSFGLYPILWDADGLDNEFVPQKYFHSAFNGILLWLFLPNNIREFITNRFADLITLSHDIEQDSHLSANAKALWHVNKEVIAYRYKVLFGNLNLILFDEVQFDNFNKFSYIFSLLEKKASLPLIECLMNLALPFSGSGSTIRIIPQRDLAIKDPVITYVDSNWDIINTDKILYSYVEKEYGKNHFFKLSEEERIQAKEDLFIYLDNYFPGEEPSLNDEIISLDNFVHDFSNNIESFLNGLR